MKRPARCSLGSLVPGAVPSPRDGWPTSRGERINETLGAWRLRLPGTEQLLTEAELPSPSPGRSQPLACPPGPSQGGRPALEVGHWPPSLQVRTLTGVPFRARLHSSVEQGGPPTGTQPLLSCLRPSLPLPSSPPPPPRVRGPQVIRHVRPGPVSWTEGQGAVGACRERAGSRRQGACAGVEGGV